MEKSHRLWVLALVLGIGGCSGEESGSPAAGTAGAGGPAKPAVNQVDTSGGQAASGPAAATGTGTNAAPAPSKGDSKKADAPSLEGPKTDASHDDGKPVKLTDAEIAKIKTLPAAEQDLALKQAVCPVSGDHLGNMGAPFKIVAEGRTFYLCCKSCEDDVKADPKAVIAKLDKK
jgi:YHS domain-containing protein